MERSQNWPDLRSPISKFWDINFIDTLACSNHWKFQGNRSVGVALRNIQTFYEVRSLHQPPPPPAGRGLIYQMGFRTEQSRADLRRWEERRGREEKWREGGGRAAGTGESHPRGVATSCCQRYMYGCMTCLRRLQRRPAARSHLTPGRRWRAAAVVTSVNWPLIGRPGARFTRLRHYIGSYDRWLCVRHGGLHLPPIVLRW